jgi:hypothetical protein
VVGWVVTDNQLFGDTRFYRHQSALVSSQYLHQFLSAGHRETKTDFNRLVRSALYIKYRYVLLGIPWGEGGK